VLRFLVVLVWNLVRAAVTLPLWVLTFRFLRRRPRAVTLRLRGDLPEVAPWPGGWLAQRLGAGRGAGGADASGPQSPQSIEELARACRRLAKDERLAGVLLHVGTLRVGWARARSIRAALAPLRAAGKKVVAFLEEAGNLEYYVACAATEIVAPPQASVGLAGIAATATFLAEALTKAGVAADFVAIGRYKSAPEMFTRAGMSEAHRESAQALLADLTDELVAAVAEGRKLAPEEARRRIDEGPYLAPRALAAGLLDEVGYPDTLHERLGLESDRAVGSLAAWADARRPPVRWIPLLRRPAVALLDWRGTIVQGDAPGALAFRGAIASGPAIKELEAVRRLDRARAVVVHVDSRGGSANASDLIARELGRLREKKPVVVYMGEAAASGGYYLAAAGTRIVAQPTTLTGSIGVFSGKFSAAEGLARFGVHQEVLEASRHAGMYGTARAFTTEERVLLEREIGDVYDGFVGHVAAGRKMTPEAVRAVAEGRVWSGKSAQERGLVDELGTLDDAVRLAAAAASIPGPPEDVERLRVRARRPGGLLRLLSDAVRPGGGADADGLVGWLAGEGGPLGAAADVLASAALALESRARAWLLLPWRWTFK
jgi:protease-4